MKKNRDKNEDVYDTISQNVKLYRKRKGITQAELAELAEYSHEFIRRIEAPNSKKNFSIDTISNIARVLDVSIEILFDKKKLEIELLKDAEKEKNSQKR